MISLAAAALLAVVPVVSPAVVHAADTTSTTTTLNSNAENPVITYNGKKYDSNQDITAAIANSSFSRVPLKEVVLLSKMLKMHFLLPNQVQIIQK